MTATLEALSTSNGIAHAAAAIETISPDRAAAMLAKNNNVRTVSRARVLSYAEQMTNGDFHLSSSAICISPNGELLNGQHRMHALVESETTQQFIVLYNQPKDIVDLVDDIGKKRSFGDILSGRAVVNANAAAAVTMFLVNKRQDGSNRKPGHAELLRMIDAEPFIHETASLAWSANKNAGIPNGVFGGTWILCRAQAPDEADYFFRTLATTEMNFKESDLLIYQLRHRLLAEKAKPSGRPNRRWIEAMLIKAWNAWITGTEVKTLRFRVGGSKPEKFPEIVGPTLDDR